MGHKVAFITGASRGIGACCAVELARAGYDVAITGRTLEEGEQHEHGSWGSNTSPLPGSLRATARSVQELGREALCLRSDILDPVSVEAAFEQSMEHFGRIDLLLNNACYQGPGNMQRLLEVTPAQLQNIYQGNIFTPLLLVQKALPHMRKQGGGTIVNMVSGSAIHRPPAAPDDGGWGFAYPSSKAALIRMAGTLLVEHKDLDLKVFNVEPGFVLTEVMKANGLDAKIAERFRPTAPESVARVIRWLVEEEAAREHMDSDVISAPKLARILEKQAISSA